MSHPDYEINLGDFPMKHEAIRVHVIDDDESVRRALRLLLQSAGYRSLDFRSAEEYLDTKDPGEYGVVIVDMRMPGMTGMELIKKLSARKDRVKVIAVSAYDDAQTWELTGELGVVAFFRKPVDDQALIDTIEWAMRNNKS